MLKNLTLSDRIKRRRLSLNLTQKELAKRLYVSPQAISRWEVGISGPDVEILPQLAEVLCYDFNTLLDYQVNGAQVIRRETAGRRSVVRGLMLETLRLMPQDHAPKVLTIGCDDGHSALVFARNGCDVTAFDIDDGRVDGDRKEATKYGIDINFFRADVLDYKFDTDFDVIFVAGVLHHIPATDRVRLISEMQNHTKVNGLNVFDVPIHKKFVTSPNDDEQFWRPSDLFDRYDDNWLVETFGEFSFAPDEDGDAQNYCVAAMIARLITAKYAPPPRVFCITQYSTGGMYHEKTG